MNKERDEIFFALWGTRRLNLERAMQAENDIDAYMCLSIHAHWLDVMLTRTPEMMDSYGMRDHALGSLRLIEGLLWEIKTGVDVPLEQGLIYG